MSGSSGRIYLKFNSDSSGFDFFGHVTVQTEMRFEGPIIFSLISENMVGKLLG